jgi:hypothetical protein
MPASKRARTIGAGSRRIEMRSLVIHVESAGNARL